MSNQFFLCFKANKSVEKLQFFPPKSNFDFITKTKVCYIISLFAQLHGTGVTLYALRYKKKRHTKDRKRLKGGFLLHKTTHLKHFSFPFFSLISRYSVSQFMLFYVMYLMVRFNHVILRYHPIRQALSHAHIYFYIYVYMTFNDSTFKEMDI